MKAKILKKINLKKIKYNNDLYLWFGKNKTKTEIQYIFKIKFKINKLKKNNI